MDREKPGIWYAEMQEWYQQSTGQYLLELEKKVLDSILPTCFGYYLLQIGGSVNVEITKASPIHEKIFLHPKAEGNCNIVGNAENLPFADNSIDVIILNHVLEFSAEPHSVLREIERVLRPEGYLIQFSFSPWGWYGLRRLFSFFNRKAPWSGHYFSAYRLIDWLNLLGVTLLSKHRLCAVPPINHLSMQHFLAPLDRFFTGYSWVPMAGVYLLLAKKQVSTLTAIKPNWLQRNLFGIHSDALRPTTRNQS